jgi:hypothetical protein
MTLPWTQIGTKRQATSVNPHRFTTGMSLDVRPFGFATTVALGEKIG